MPSRDYAFEALTCGDCNSVDHFAVFEYAVHSDVLFQESLGKLHFLPDVAAVDLYFHHMRLLLACNVLVVAVMVVLLQVGMSNNTYDTGFTLEKLKLIFDEIFIFVCFLNLRLECDLQLLLLLTATHSLQEILSKVLSPNIA